MILRILRNQGGREPKRRKQIAERVFEPLASGLSQYGAIGPDDKR